MAQGFYNLGMGKCTPAEQHRLICDNMGLAESIAAIYRGRRGIPFEDLVAAGREGLCKSATLFNPKRAVKFTTFAHEYIEGYVKNFIASWQYLIPLSEPDEIELNFHSWDIWGHAAPYESWTSLTATPEDLAIAFDDLRDKHAKVKTAWRFLPPLERSVIHARFFRDPPQALNSIAREYKMPYATLVDFINRTLRTLKENIESRQAA